MGGESRVTLRCSCQDSRVVMLRWLIAGHVLNGIVCAQTASAAGQPDMQIELQSSRAQAASHPTASAGLKGMSPDN